MIIKTILAIVLFLIAYGGFLIYDVPSAWLLSRVNPQLAPAHARLSDPRGGAWSGSGQLLFNGASLGRITWNTSFWPLISGHLDARLQLQGNGITAHGRINADKKQLVVTHLKGRADLVLLAQLANLPAQAQGTLIANLTRIRLSQRGRLEGAQGTVDIHGTRIPDLGVNLGTLHLLLSPGSGKNIIHGTITNNGGDLGISGRIDLYNGVRYTLIAYLKPYPGSKNDPMRDAFAALLGSPDARGRYRYTASGRLTP
ncbi:MAG: type II secretion system protein N [Gammaproteobacteria bacterium]